MLTHSLGFPRIGPDRELKRTCERYWSGKASREDLEKTARDMRAYKRQVHLDRGIDLVPSNDFSFYDQVLDTCLMTGAIPERFKALLEREDKDELDLYFAMARGYQQDGLDLIPMEMTKWFDTNYHYIVPEFTKDQEFQWFSDKVVEEFREAKEAGVTSKPTLIGPVSFLLLGKESERGFDRIDLLERLLPVYKDVLQRLAQEGAEWVQLEEPFLAMDLSDKRLNAFDRAYAWIRDAAASCKLLLATYFEGLRDNADKCFQLPVDAVHLDLVRAPDQLKEAFARVPEGMMLSLGLIDGRNIWKNDIRASWDTVSKAMEKFGQDRLMLGTSCSLLHCPYDLEVEQDSEALPEAVKEWMAFAVQKLDELKLLRDLAASEEGMKERSEAFSANVDAHEGRKSSEKVHDQRVQDRVSRIDEGMAKRKSPFPERK
ncbi:MAG: 5-methyltetrahydropteroyltriglutamate--homocysteine S-methyltransferase, partial [Flavobacteriales bacterium]